MLRWRWIAVALPLIALSALAAGDPRRELLDKLGQTAQDLRQAQALQIQVHPLVADHIRRHQPATSS